MIRQKCLIIAAKQWIASPMFLANFATGDSRTAFLPAITGYGTLYYLTSVLSKNVHHWPILH